MPSTPWGPYPWEPGGSWPWDQPAQPQDQAAAPAQPDHSARDALIQDLIAKHGAQVGTQSTVYNKPTAAQTAAATTDQQKQDLLKSLDSGFDLYQFNDGTTIELSPDGNSRNYKPASAAEQAANNPTPVSANTTDPNIVMRDPKTGAITTVANPNYKPPAGTTVSGTTTEPNILTRNADGTITSTPNPNYKPPVGTSVAANTTDPNIVTRNADGTITTTPNPNYQAPAAAPISTNTTDPTIVLRDPKTGALSTQPNPNYQPPAAAPVASNTTDPNIVLRDPKTGAISTVPNPNYQKPSATVVSAPGTSDQFIITRDPTSGAISQQPNPNYVPPRPTQITPSTTSPYITTQDAQGNLTSVPNPSYVPTDPGRMTAQLQQQADQQWQTLQQQVQQGKITSDQAASQFDQYWNENIEPVKGDIAAAQAKAQSAIAQQQAMTGYYQAQAANIPATLAQNASDAAQKNFIAMLPYVGGKGYGDTMSQLMSSLGTGKFPKLDPQALAAASTYS
ncbi:MAG: hypothetical protein J2P17_25250, partial [Mycobacterium sp.]|nr:hypothetical protein [Mycobacterium sp.]